MAKLRQDYVDHLRQNAINFAAGGPLPEAYVRKVAEDTIADVVEFARGHERDVGIWHKGAADAIESEFTGGRP